MHQLIRCLVYAKDETKALSKAKSIFENMCGEGLTYDYFTMFDEEGSEVSGKGRWGDLPAVSLATSKEGKKLIDEGMKFTKQNFMENIKIIRDYIKKYTDEDLFNEEIMDTKTRVANRLEGVHNIGLRDFRYRCYCAGQYQGSDIYLYDSDGEGIRNERHLNDVLSKWGDLYKDESKENPYKDMEIFICLADVHY